MGDANDVRPGDEVVALGFPLGNLLGRDYTVTTGVVSSRRIYGNVERIQTDAAINPGNSGGPLVNREGHVIGVVTGGFSSYEGISFAISVTEVKEHLDSLAMGDNVTTDAKGDWWTYENDDCKYSLLVHPNWTVVEENDACGAYFERYDGTDLLGTVRVWGSGLDWQTLREFAESWRDGLVKQGRGWETFDLIAFEPSDHGHNGYHLKYIGRKSNEYCISSHADLIVKSNYYNNALIFSSGFCTFVPQSVVNEVGTMEFGY